MQVQGREPAREVLDIEGSSSDTSEILREFGFADKSPDACVLSDGSFGRWGDGGAAFIEEQRRALDDFNKSRDNFYSGPNRRCKKAVSSRSLPTYGRVKMCGRKHKFFSDAGPSTAEPDEPIRSDLPPPPPGFSAVEWA